MKEPKLPRAEIDDDFILDLSNLPPRVPDGIYNAVLIRHETKFMFKSGKLFLMFRIVDPGEHYGKELYRVYRVTLVGKRKFKVQRGSLLFEMLSRVCNIRVRPDRVTLLWLKHCVLKIKTRTVTMDYRQKPLADWLCYSVVDDVLEKEAGC